MIIRLGLAGGLLVALVACSSTDLGSGGSMVQGSAGTAGNAQGQELAIRTCDEPLGTMALVERQDTYALAQYGLESPVPMLRLMAAQSGCFAVVERGQALGRMQQERDLASSGMLQGGSNVGGGQMVAADYLLTPFVTFSEDDAGGVGGALGGLLGSSLGNTVAGLVGGVEFQEAQTFLTLVEQRSGIQAASAEGSAKSTDVLGGAFAASGLGGLGGLGGYSSTNEGKVVAAAFLDAFNGLVDQVRAQQG
jgi:hypothetical protein